MELCLRRSLTLKNLGSKQIKNRVIEYCLEPFKNFLKGLKHLQPPPHPTLILF